MQDITMSTDQGIDRRKEYLTFSLGHEQYGVDILKVQEIRGWEPLRKMPDVPDYFKGVMDFRGRILPVIDLRIRFEIQDIEYKSTTVIIVLSTSDDNYMMGVVVDAVSDVLSVSQGDIKSAPEMGSNIKTDYVIGMVTREEGMIMLVDTELLVNREEIEVKGIEKSNHD
jgi:purine-binding chemotaxis protein CheW